MQDTKFLLPVSRLVQGSVSKPNTKNMNGQPLTNKNGEPRVDYFVAVAIPKAGEQHWNQTHWGKIIWELGNSFYPNGKAKLQNFHWKISDGDCTIANIKGKRPCDYAGFSGHWILKLNSGIPPVLCDRKTRAILPPEMFKPGNYVQCYINVASNKQETHAGIFLNFSVAAFVGYGPQIAVFEEVDLDNIGLEDTPLPAYISAVPLGAEAVQVVSANHTPAVGEVQYMPPAYPQILTPPPPPAPAVMVKYSIDGHAATLDEWKAAGWPEELVKQRGQINLI